jgi:SNF2 family DNA or RNA helicase
VVQGSGKLQTLQLLLDVLSGMGKRAVIAAHASLNVLSDYLRLKYGEKHFHRIDEDTMARDRDRAIADFNDPSKPHNLIVVEVASCSLGTDLKAADAIIVYDSDGHPSGDIQRFGCARHMGDPAKLLVFRLYCCGTLEEVIASVRHMPHHAQCLSCFAVKTHRCVALVAVAKC